MIEIELFCWDCWPTISKLRSSGEGSGSLVLSPVTRKVRVSKSNSVIWFRSTVAVTAPRANTAEVVSPKNKMTVRISRIGLPISLKVFAGDVASSNPIFELLLELAAKQPARVIGYALQPLFHGLLLFRIECFL